MVVGFSSAYSSPGIDSMNQTAIFRDEINTNSVSILFFNLKKKLLINNCYLLTQNKWVN